MKERLHFINPIYEERLQKLRKKKAIRREKNLLGDKFYNINPNITLKCRVHGKRRKEKILSALCRMDEKYDRRFVDVKWHGVIGGEYEYMTNHWVWVVDLRYYPIL